MTKLLVSHFIYSEVSKELTHEKPTIGLFLNMCITWYEFCYYFLICCVLKTTGMILHNLLRIYGY